MDWITTWDFSILDWIQAHLRCGAADQFFSTITHLADGGVFWILLAVVLLAALIEGPDDPSAILTVTQRTLYDTGS